MCAKAVKTVTKDVGTTGHSWDGIEELNNPLPRWWVWVLYLTIIWAVAYTVAYPAWPLLTGATPGVLGASTRADVADEIKRFDDANAGIKAKLVAADLAAIDKDPELQQFAMSAGAAVFRTNCAQCHGAGAAGVQGKGYPNLLDNDWLFGGDLDAIHTTITHGIRNATDPDARNVGIFMPAWSAKAVPGPMTDAATAQFSDEELAQVVNHVLKISGQAADEALATAWCHAVCRQLRGLPCRGRHRQPRHGLAQPDGRDLALRRRRGDADRHDCERPWRCHAGVGLCRRWRDTAAERGPDPRRGGLCPLSGWRRIRFPPGGDLGRERHRHPSCSRGSWGAGVFNQARFFCEKSSAALFRTRAKAVRGDRTSKAAAAGFAQSPVCDTLFSRRPERPAIRGLIWVKARRGQLGHHCARRTGKKSCHCKKSQSFTPRGNRFFRAGCRGGFAT